MCTNTAAQLTNCSVLKFLSVWLCNLSLFEVVKMCLMITATARSLLAAHPCWLVTTRCPQHCDSPGRWQTNTAERRDKHCRVRGHAARTWQPPSSERGVVVTLGLFVSRLWDFLLPHCYLTSEVAFYESCCESQLATAHHSKSILTSFFFRKSHMHPGFEGINIKCNNKGRK